MRIIRRIGHCTLLGVVLMLCLGWARSYFYYDELNLHLESEKHDAGLEIGSRRGYLDACIIRELGDGNTFRPTAATWFGIFPGAKEVSHAWESGRYTTPDSPRRPEARCLYLRNYNVFICGQGTQVLRADVPYWLPISLGGVPMIGMLAWGAWSARHARRGFAVMQQSLVPRGASLSPG